MRAAALGLACSKSAVTAFLISDIGDIDFGIRYISTKAASYSAAAESSGESEYIFFAPIPPPLLVFNNWSAGRWISFFSARPGSSCANYHLSIFMTTWGCSRPPYYRLYSVSPTLQVIAHYLFALQCTVPLCSLLVHYMAILSPSGIEYLNHTQFIPKYIK